MILDNSPPDSGSIRDERFGGSQPPSGDEPSTTVIRLRQYLEAGRVADLGVGDGGNALFLARLGFDVLAVDGSREAIAGLRAKAAEEGIGIETLVCDLREWKPKELFDGFVCHGVLHSFPRHEGLSLIRRIQVHTRSGGAVSLAARSSPVPAPGPVPSAAEHLYRPGELESIFQGWQVVVVEETSIGPRGNPGRTDHSVVRIFAIRP